MRLLTVATVWLALISHAAIAAGDELPSWNEGPARAAIIEFVARVSDEGSLDFVPAEQRIAVFDNDGTMWSEQPTYFQVSFMVDRVKALAPERPEWRTTEPFRSILEGDLSGIAKSGERGIMELGMATHAGMTSGEFADIVADWFATARHPRFDRPYDEMTFLPMVELLEYLRNNGFKTFVVSGGGIEFMRPVTERIYGIPPEQVVGSSIDTRYDLEDDTPVLRRLPKVDFVDDGPGKPVGINRHIGRRPIFVAGNSDSDYEMLRWVTSGTGPSLGIVVHHTDAAREWAYDRGSSVGRLEKVLDEAPKRGWHLIDMKRDWKKVFADDNRPTPSK
ncbi:HAD family hydrolase [Aureimonas altamirensis]|uniref:HAD family hydrolase n=1 Tax=Aureimonas altamirensis TaxID=370622 RepID=UPI0012DFFF42|nr:HAD family hydrolase [Aureimonas altamirensis]